MGIVPTISLQLVTLSTAYAYINISFKNIRLEHAEQIATWKSFDGRFITWKIIYYTNN